METTRTNLDQRTKYKMIPVDEQTYERLVVVCQAHRRKQGAQVRLMVDSEYEKLLKLEEKDIQGDRYQEVAQEG